MENFKVGDKVESLYYGIGIVVKVNFDTSVRVDGFSKSLLRPVYWQDGKQYNPMNVQDCIKALGVVATDEELRPLLERLKRFE